MVPSEPEARDATSPVPPPDASRDAPLPRTNPLNLTDPLRWLARGASDLAANPGPSLFYGGCFAGMGWALVAVFRGAHEYTTTLTLGFLLLGPFLATGLYDLSRQREQGRRARLLPSLVSWRANTAGLALYVMVLTIIMLVWARASLVTFALFFSRGLPTLTDFVAQVVSIRHVDFLLTYIGVGGFFAALVYAISAVSVPMMLDRSSDSIRACFASVRALHDNPGPMLLWAALIVLLIGIGFATAFVGLVITAPLVGHATWHAYRAAVVADPPAAGPPATQPSP
jgi:uncharacterized membrane protein